MKEITVTNLQVDTIGCLKNARQEAQLVSHIGKEGLPVAVIIGFSAWCELQAFLPSDHPLAQSQDDAFDLARRYIEAAEKLGIGS